ncbi:hypothetical protein SPBRAN_1287 [uncultured Candidatus Thioglobus sp.]|nr:hypothetical protein SPBRAN_1287 [uncultured Candidatus Thioglobus sp.]
MAGIEIWKQIKEQGIEPSEKVFFEVGTGRVPLVSLAYWLMGADKIISMDLNPSMKEELIIESPDYISQNQEEILSLFGALIIERRFEKLLQLSKSEKFKIIDFFKMCQISYIAPGDASDTQFSDQSIDFHTSYNVFEHIPKSMLKKILKEGNRIIKKDGLFIHIIDYSDHFSHSDKNISAINFLQYSDDDWDKYASNRYMYMNRIRHDDFLALFESSGQSTEHHLSPILVFY